METDGSNFHLHEISDFNQTNHAQAIYLNTNDRDIIIINGTVDFKETCHQTINNVPAELEMNTLYGTITVTLDSEAIGNHFAEYEGGPNEITGYIKTIKDKNGVELLNQSSVNNISSSLKQSNVL